jgi:hypothetical protein
VLRCSQIASASIASFCAASRCAGFPRKKAGSAAHRPIALATGAPSDAHRRSFKQGKLHARSLASEEIEQLCLWSACGLNTIAPRLVGTVRMKALLLRNIRGRLW